MRVGGVLRGWGPFWGAGGAKPQAAKLCIQRLFDRAVRRSLECRGQLVDEIAALNGSKAGAQRIERARSLDSAQRVRLDRLLVFVQFVGESRPVCIVLEGSYAKFAPSELVRLPEQIEGGFVSGGDGGLSRVCRFCIRLWPADDDETAVQRPGGRGSERFAFVVEKANECAAFFQGAAQLRFGERLGG